MTMGRHMATKECDGECVCDIKLQYSLIISVNLGLVFAAEQRPPDPKAKYCTQIFL